MASSYSIGDELSSSNYAPQYCNKCQADSVEECICIKAKVENENKTTSAVARPVSVTPIKLEDVLIDTILRLPEKEFWDLVNIRLNRPKGIHVVRDFLGKDLYAEIIELNDKPSIVEFERWTELRLVEQLFLELATTKLIVSHTSTGDCGITICKYYNQALALHRWILFTRPPPEFVVNLSDLSTRVIAELKVLNDPQVVLKQAVGRIFENIDPVQYHLSIASQLKVRLAS